MIKCKKTIIATCFSIMLPFTVGAEAVVVDDSDNFAMFDERQAANDAPVTHPKYDEPRIEHAQLDSNYQEESTYSEDGPALAKEEPNAKKNTNFNENAQLIDKVQNLQQEVQELRGQLEVQAHDLKLLQEQQIAFYKDLDSRLSGTPLKTAQNKPTPELNIASKQPNTPVGLAPTSSTNKVQTLAAPVIPVSRTNPADEQINYLAAYELVKNKRYDDALKAMQIFVQKYPKGGYTANAEYWLGELYLVKRNYSQAIEHFDIVLQQFPSSSKAAASLLKSGYAFVAKGNKQEAKKRFQQVIQTYPDTPTAQLASSKLETIKTL